MIAKERLHWNASKTKLVKEGDSDATFLAYPAGQAIAKEHEDLVKATGTSEKEDKKSEDKEDKKSEDKGKKLKFGGGK